MSDVKLFIDQSQLSMLVPGGESTRAMGRIHQKGRF